MKSEYELLREEKIARNQLRLAELGLLNGKNTVREKVGASDDGRKDTMSGTPNRSIQRPFITRSSIQIPLRRSSRINSTQHFDSNKKEVLAHSLSKGTKQGHAFKKISQNKVKVSNRQYQKPHGGRASFSLSSVPKARATAINIAKITKHFLGKELQYTGKAFAVSTAVVCSEEPNFDEFKSLSAIFSHSISFNKYCGILEWKNNSFFLWVNIDGKPNDAGLYNEFLDNGKQMTWFGGSKMHDETPLIEKLIAAGKESNKVFKEKEQSSPDEADGIILFCRLLDEKKRPRPYTCMGRVGYHSHIPGSRPLQFVWNLIDHEGLTNDDTLQLKDGENVSIFQELVNF